VPLPGVVPWLARLSICRPAPTAPSAIDVRWEHPGVGLFKYNTIDADFTSGTEGFSFTDVNGNGTNSVEGLTADGELKIRLGNIDSNSYSNMKGCGLRSSPLIPTR
jgi:hypothetical protein